MANVGFRKDTVQKVSQGLFRVLRKKVDSILNNSQSLITKAFYGFSKPPVDTRETIESTGVKASFQKERVAIRFSSENSRDYAQFPLLGLSTSAKYGERNWLKKSAELTTKEILTSKKVF